MLEFLRNKNSSLDMLPATDDYFRRYGRFVDEYDFTPWLRVMEDIAVPSEGNTYIADEPRLTIPGPFDEVRSRIFAGMPIQVGYCNGNGSKLDALEYHKMPELVVAATDIVLLLADIHGIVENRIDSSCIKAFYLPSGTACELYGTTMHFAPCKVSGDGFKCIIVLPKGTNMPMETPAPLCDEDKLLRMTGKWLIAHKESVLASKGAFIGIHGDNIEIVY